MTSSIDHRKSGDSFHSLVEDARQGSSEALGVLFERFRAYLTQVAFEELDSDLRVKESPSDLVQKSFMEAATAFDKFQGDAADSLKGWLRQILVNNLRDVRHHYRTDKRQISREVELGENVAGECLVDATPPADAAIRREQTQALNSALEKLDPDDRQLIAWRHLENRPFAQIAVKLSITEEAARKRWARAVQGLRQLTQTQPQKQSTDLPRGAQ